MVEGVEVEDGEPGLEGFVGVETVDEVTFLGDEEDGCLESLVTDFADESLAVVVGVVLTVAECAGGGNEGEAEAEGLADKGIEGLGGLGTEEAGVFDLGQFGQQHGGVHFYEDATSGKVFAIIKYSLFWNGWGYAFA